MFETSQVLGGLDFFSRFTLASTPVRRSFAEVHGHFNRSWE